MVPLREGDSCNTFSTMMNENAEKVAIKIFYSEILEQKRVEALKNLNHENIVKIKHWFQLDHMDHPGRWFLCMELCNKSNLAEMLRINYSKGLNEQKLNLLLGCLSGGLQHLNEKKIIHGNIRPSKIVLHSRSDGSELFKLIGLEFATVEGSASKYTPPTQSVCYWHPYVLKMHLKKEEFKEESSYNREYIDLWSVGVTLYEAVTAKAAIRTCKESMPEDMMENLQKAYSKEEKPFISLVEGPNENWIAHDRFPEGTTISKRTKETYESMVSSLMSRNTINSKNTFHDFMGQCKNEIINWKHMAEAPEPQQSTRVSTLEPPASEEPNIEFKYTLDDFEFNCNGEPFAKGGGGKVFLGCYKSNKNEEVAVKIFPTLVSTSSEDPVSEAFSLQTFSGCQSVVKILANGCEQIQLKDDVKPYSYQVIVMEYCKGGNLSNLLEKKFPNGLSDEYFIPLVKCLGETFKAMRDESFVHRDLKAANICLYSDDSKDSEILFKVIDYGLAANISVPYNDPFSPLFYGLGTLPYMHPRQIEKYLNVKKYDENTKKEKNDDTFTNKAYFDLWALGVILYEAATGKKPFEIMISDEEKKLKGETRHRRLSQKYHDLFVEKKKKTGIISMKRAEGGEWIEGSELPATIPLHKYYRDKLNNLLVQLLGNQENVRQENMVADFNRAMSEFTSSHIVEIIDHQ